MAVLAKSGNAEYLLVELALPGRPATVLGVLLFDPASSRLLVQLREDIEDLADPEDAEVLTELERDFALKIDELGGRGFLEYLEDSLSNVIRLSPRHTTEAPSLPWKLRQLYEEHVVGAAQRPERERRGLALLPVYSLRAAAGRFGEDIEVEAEGQVEAPADLRVTPDMYALHVVGHSMEPDIPDGSLAVFRYQPAGTRQGKRVLVWNRGASESGGEFTVKTYRSRKRVTEDGWEHASIRLEPENPDFEPLELDASRDYQVLGEFIRLL